MTRHYASKEAYEIITLLQNDGIHQRHFVFMTFMCLTPIVWPFSPGQVEVRQGPKL